MGSLPNTLMGGLTGALANQREGTTDAGNLFAMRDSKGNLASPAEQNAYTRQLQQIGFNGANQTYADQDPTKQVGENSILGQLYGGNGQDNLLSRTLGDEKNLNSTGWQLNDQDRTAYGQASGDIARMFGQNEQSLSQALSDRGLSNSGVAGQAFSNSLGNKNEQLGQLQAQIAQHRMEMNQQRLAQTRNFLGQLGGQAQTAIQSQFGRNIAQSEDAMNRGKAAEDYLGNIQNQSNENLGQQQQTGHRSTLSNALGGTWMGNMMDQQNIMSMGKMMMGGGRGGGGAGGGMSGGAP